MNRLITHLCLACALPLLVPADVTACAIALPSMVQPSAQVRLGGEEALIVWDERRQTQHFVRTAAFENASRDFGFLVPTPSVPTLAEVNARVFDDLFQLYRVPPPPPTPQPQAVARGRHGGPATAAAPPQVEVLERVTVAGLDAAVLRANDADALSQWLAEHDYASSAPLRDWFVRYVREGWIVTAFRIDPGDSGGRFATRAVRMSFGTDAPFFPYSEPRVSPRPPERPFRVSVVSPSPMRVRPGLSGWHGVIGYRGRPRARLARALREVVPSGSFRASDWLTTFDEPRSVRGHDAELFFEPDPGGGDVESTLDQPLGVWGSSRPAPRGSAVNPWQ